MLTSETGRAMPEPLAANLNDHERWGSAIAGGALLLFGLTRLSIPALVVTAVGGALLSQGVTGYCPFRTAASDEGNERARRRLSDDEQGRTARVDSPRSGRKAKAEVRRHR